MIAPSGLRLSTVCALALVLLAQASSVRAFGGLELSPGGARALARGGAIVARPEDAFALMHNPAGLAMLSKDQLLLAADTALHDMCVTPYGYYGWGVYEAGTSEFGNSSTAPYATDPLNRVCNSAPVLPQFGLAYTLRVGDELGLGFGMAAPTGLTGLQYGGADATIGTADGARPTPTRYQLVRQRITFAYGPMAGVGYRVLPRLRLGLMLQWVGVGVETSVVQALRAGTAPDDDMFATLTAKDYFIPGGMLGVFATPVDFLDVALTLRAYDGFSGSGEIRYITAAFWTDASDPGDYVPFKNDPLKASSVETGIPWVGTIGVRYVQALPNAPRDQTGVPLRGDPLATEQFDVELDAAYQINTRASKGTVTVAPGELIYRKYDGTSDPPIKVPNPDLATSTFDKHTQNAGSVRLGSTYNFWPGHFGASAGVSYETRGVDPSYANIDSFAFARIGMGLGVIARAWDWDFAVGYGHIFQETLVVAPPDHEEVQDATDDDPTSGFDKRVGIATGSPRVLQEQNAPKASDVDAVAKLQQSAGVETPVAHRRVVNAGVYKASFDIFSLSVAYRF